MQLTTNLFRCNDRKTDNQPKSQFISENLVAKNFRFHRFVVNISVAASLTSSSLAMAAPKIFSLIKNGQVTTTYKHNKAFVFSREYNNRVIASVLSRLPMAQTAVLVASGKPIKSSEYKNEKLGYTQRNLKQVHFVAVTFARSDYLPVMYFQVREDWKDCEGNPQYCSDTLSLEITGPSKVVRDLNDFASFPTTLNVLNATLSLENQSGTTFGPTQSPALVRWEMSFSQAENGVDDYLRYLRSRAIKSERRITLQNLKGAMALWASTVSRQAFQNL